MDPRRSEGVWLPSRRRGLSLDTPHMRVVSTLIPCPRAAFVCGNESAARRRGVEARSSTSTPRIERSSKRRSASTASRATTSFAERFALTTANFSAPKSSRASSVGEQRHGESRRCKSLFRSLGEPAQLRGLHRLDRVPRERPPATDPGAHSQRRSGHHGQDGPTASRRCRRGLRGALAAGRRARALLLRPRAPDDSAPGGAKVQQGGQPEHSVLMVQGVVRHGGFRPQMGPPRVAPLGRQRTCRQDDGVLGRHVWPRFERVPARQKTPHLRRVTGPGLP